MSESEFPTQKCDICSKMRPLAKHLFELSQYCLYLGGSASYQSGDGSREVFPSTIGSWLELASQLKNVEINAWEFSGSDGFYCGTVADYYDRNSKHYSSYSTDLTRFIFICNALEETYRFVVGRYETPQFNKKFRLDKKLRGVSLKAAYLVNQCSKMYVPDQLVHICSNFEKAFSYYRKVFPASLSGMNNVNSTDLNYGLHLLRNLRNYIAHGVFPLMEHPENIGSSYLADGFLEYLLKSGSRTAALYIQMFLGQFFNGFNSWEYDQVDGACGEEFDRFLDNCSPTYCRSLHFIQDFEFEDWIGYREDGL
ncbi:hypothetical protein [Kordiimonas sp.]|uniref:hypothetical protein n=1 Tax=Kordiimonas sp. TaxID=1970157 RepID=UPI003A94CB67